MQERYDVFGVGNAIVDTEVRIDDMVLTSHGLERGLMTLVAVEEQEALLQGLDGYERAEAAGGSAANTMVGIARFGGRAFYAGKVGDDMAGALYRESMAEAGVDFAVEAGPGSTGTCLVLVSPDGERTMQTNLGASSMLTPADIQPERIARSDLLYVEGYLWAGEGTKAAAERAIELAKSAGISVALSLSDPVMVQFFGDAFLEVVRSSVDIVFCNEHEAAIYAGASTGGQTGDGQTGTSAAQRAASLKALADDCGRVFMTCGADGAVAYDHGTETHVPGHVVTVVDTTGAGDVFAAGALYGLTHDMGAADSAKLGSYAAAVVITDLGPRLGRSLAGDLGAILAGAKP